MAWEKWYTGKTLASFTYQALGSWMGMKMSERNRSGRIVKLTTAGAASAFGTNPVRGRPRGEKLAAPTARGARDARGGPPGRAGPEKGLPQAAPMATGHMATRAAVA